MMNMHNVFMFYRDSTGWKSKLNLPPKDLRVKTSVCLNKINNISCIFVKIGILFSVALIFTNILNEL